MDSIALSLVGALAPLHECPLPGEQHAMLSLMALESVFVLIVGVGATLGATWLRRLPTFHVCPTCLHHTQPIQLPPGLRALRRYVTRRWCPNCAWEGTGRKAPYYVPGNLLAHRSGFRWGSPDQEASS